MPNSTTPLITGGSLHDSQTIKLPTSEQEIFPYEAYQHSDLTTELPKEDVEKMEKSVSILKPAFLFYRILIRLYFRNDNLVDILFLCTLGFRQ